MASAISLNWLAVAAAVLANIGIGFLWYGPLLGSAWMKEMGMSPDFKPDPAQLKRSMLVMIVSALLTAVVLACAIELSRPDAASAGDDVPDVIYGLTLALGAWIGFVVPLLLSGVAWENRSWKLFGINAGYHLAALLAAGWILAVWR
jgi:Protein of unknown function (DUF1761)